nr:6625_t:CDS:2 [Entrophospora candida]
MSENYFYLNRNQPNRVLYFKEWLPSIYLPSVKILRRNNVNVAETQYRQEIRDAITTCGEEQRRTFYKEVWTKEKEKRQTLEQERNVNIIQENIEFILGRCRAKIENGCSDTIMLAYTEVIRHLERLDLASIRPEAPLASGVIDLSGSEDPFTNLLSSRTKQILMHHTFHNDDFPGEINMMMDDFVSTYRDLGPDFDPVFMGPIAFPHGEMTVETRRILMTVFDLLEGLPLLTEDEYSENAYVIHAVSKVLDPILKYSKWPLKRAWMERMEATNSGKKPDLQVLLKLDMVESELVLAEVSRLLPQQSKETIDWKKLVRICKDCFDERYNFFFDGRDDTTDTARSLNIELGKVPVLGIQIVEEFLKNALKLRSVVEKIIAMAVGVKDEINLLPVIEDRAPSSSMMSTTYSPPRSY